MSNRTKQFKIGEYAIGGIIKVEIVNDYVFIDALDYNTKKSVLHDKYIYRLSDKWDVDNKLHDLTSAYYSGKIIDYIYK